MAKRIPGLLLVLLAALCLSILGGTEGSQAKGTEGTAGPVPAQSGIGPDGALRPTAGDRCPVCGMYPARHPKFAAALVLEDGRTFYACSNRCLLQCWRHSQTHLGVPSGAIKRLLALDYFSGAVLDAERAFWVAGSDVVGPMGPALVALQTRRDVDTFIKRHGGSLVFQLHQVDESLWKKIVMKPHK